MIRLTFSKDREIMRFVVRDKEIFYGDRVWTEMIRLIPKDEHFIRKVIASRNVIPNQLIQMFTLSKVEQAEYDEAKNKEDPERALSDNIIKDCKAKGLIFIKEEKA